MKLLQTFFLSLSLLLLLAHSALAQKTKYYGGVGGFDVGTMNVNMDGFNQFLPEGYPQLSGDFLTLGGDGYFMFENFIFGGYGHGLWGDQKRFQRQQITIGGGMGFFQFGYAFLATDKIKLYPFLGLGGGGMTMNVSAIDRQAKDDITNGVQNNQYLETNISWGSYMFDLGVGLDYMPPSEPGGPGGNGARLGLRAGYQFSPSNADFRYSGGLIDGANDFAFSGFYFRIIMGGGGFAKGIPGSSDQ